MNKKIGILIFTGIISLGYGIESNFKNSNQQVLEDVNNILNQDRSLEGISNLNNQLENEGIEYVGEQFYTKEETENILIELENLDGVEEILTEEELQVLIETGEIEASEVEEFQYIVQEEEVFDDEIETGIVISEMNNATSLSNENENTVTILTPGLGATSDFWGGSNGILPKALASELKASIFVERIDELIDNDKFDYEGNIIILPTFNDKYDTIEPKVEELQNLIDVITKQNENVKINLIGHSQGGLVNLAIANENTDKIKKLVSIGTPYHPNGLAQLGSMANSVCDPLEDYLNFVCSFVYDNADDEIIPAYNELRSLNGIVQEIISDWNDKPSSERTNIDFTTIGTTLGLSYSYTLKIANGVKCSGWFNCWVTYAYVTVKIGTSLESDLLVGTTSQIGNSLFISAPFIYDSSVGRTFPKVQTDRKVVINFIPLIDVGSKAPAGDNYSGWIPHAAQGQNTKIKNEVLRRI